MLLFSRGPLRTKIQNHRLEYFCRGDPGAWELIWQKFPMPFASTVAGCSESFFAEAVPLTGSFSVHVTNKIVMEEQPFPNLFRESHL